MFDLQSCRITGREARSDATNMFTVHIVSYESTFVDESKEEYVYPSELSYVNRVPTLVDCLNHTISAFYNKDALILIRKKRITFFKISSVICSRWFDLCINGNLYKRDIDAEILSEVYDVTQSLIVPAEYISRKEIISC